MKCSRELRWLMVVVATVAVAVACFPYEVPVRRNLEGGNPIYSPTPTPQTFSFYCSGRHAKAYSGFQRPYPDFLECSYEHGLLDHP